MTTVTSGKLDLEFALSHAWRRWKHAHEYPSIGRAPKPDNVFWIGVTKSERRNMAAVVWQRAGGQYQIGFRHEGWTPDEIADVVGDRSLDDWIPLAAPFRDRLDGAV